MKVNLYPEYGGYAIFSSVGKHNNLQVYTESRPRYKQL